MAELKSKKTEDSVEDYIAALSNEQQRKDSLDLLKMMKKIMKTEPKLWSQGAIGFGEFKYSQKGKKQLNSWYLTGFSPRKDNISVMLMAGFGHNQDLLKKLGKHKTGGGCLYIKSLQDVDKKVLEELIKTNLVKFKEVMNEKGWSLA
jgi:hypothetical protein